jgi:hypothetical protein
MAISSVLAKARAGTLDQKDSLDRAAGADCSDCGATGARG